jgi:hypothetical protein
MLGTVIRIITTTTVVINKLFSLDECVGEAPVMPGLFF